MKRYASHFLFLPGYGYLKQCAVEVEEGCAVHVFSLSEEVEDTEWLPGAIILLTEEELKELDIESPLSDASGNYGRILNKLLMNSGKTIGEFSQNLLVIPPALTKGTSRLRPVYFSCFDSTTMRPVAGTRHRQLR